MTAYLKSLGDSSVYFYTSILLYFYILPIPALRELNLMTACLNPISIPISIFSTLFVSHYLSSSYIYLSHASNTAYFGWKIEKREVFAAKKIAAWQNLSKNRHLSTFFRSTPSYNTVPHANNLAFHVICAINHDSICRIPSGRLPSGRYHGVGRMIQSCAASK